jgi:hypothetical protein
MALAALLLFVPRASANLSDGLLAYWSFEDGLALAEDSADLAGSLVLGAGTHDGLVVGSPTATTGLVGGGVSFSGGAGEYLRIDSLTIQSIFSVQAWIDPDSAAGDHNAVQFGGNVGLWEVRGGGTVTNVMNDGAWQFYDFTMDGATFASSGWHHIAMTYDGSEVRIYLDGALDGVFAQTGVPQPQGAQWLGIGTNGGWADSPFDGTIDEVAFWERPLDATEIATLYNAGAGTPIPEPGTGVMVGVGLLAMRLIRSWSHSGTARRR